MQTIIAEREHLLRKLEKALTREKSIIHSPAGLVSSLINNRAYNHNALWIAMDPRDESAFNLWYLLP